MNKKITKHLLIVWAIFLIGAIIHDFAGIRGLGDFIAISGISYAALSLIVLLRRKPIALAEKAIQDRQKDKAHEELLKYKKLLDEGILNQEEFDIKSKQFKEKILED